MMQVSKVAYEHGMVVSTCRHCKQNHLIADNERKLDMGQDYGCTIESYLKAQGESVQRLTVSLQELEENFLVDNNGELKLVPRPRAVPDGGSNQVWVVFLVFVLFLNGYALLLDCSFLLDVYLFSLVLVFLSFDSIYHIEQPQPQPPHIEGKIVQFPV
jgi:hypothetical protein